VRCFHHPDVDAVGLCKGCGKGVCRACAVDLGQGLACADSCEVEVRDLIVQQAVSRRVLATTPGAYRTQAIVGFVGAGVLVSVGALLAFTPLWPTAIFSGLVALPLLLQGVRSKKTAEAVESATRQLPPDGAPRALSRGE
jgi:hypothetical protein